VAAAATAGAGASAGATAGSRVAQEQGLQVGPALDLAEQRQVGALEEVGILGVLEPGAAEALEVEVVLEPPGLEQWQAAGAKHKLVVEQVTCLLVLRLHQLADVCQLQVDAVVEDRLAV
jgi:hypothetical protein